MTQKQILNVLNREKVRFLDHYLPFPDPFKGKNKIKAIVIGADPSTDTSIRFNTVFDLGGFDHRYFNAIEKNLNTIGLALDDVYVQNFCRNYFTKTTYAQRSNWSKAASICSDYLREELDNQFSREIPLLVTSEIILRRLVHGNPLNANTYYGNPDTVPVQSDEAISDRKVFPFYRHWSYQLERPEWEAYRNKLKTYFNA